MGGSLTKGRGSDAEIQGAAELYMRLLAAMHQERSFTTADEISPTSRYYEPFLATVRVLEDLTGCSIGKHMYWVIAQRSGVEIAGDDRYLRRAYPSGYEKSVSLYAPPLHSGSFVVKQSRRR